MGFGIDRFYEHEKLTVKFERLRIDRDNRKNVVIIEDWEDIHKYAPVRSLKRKLWDLTWPWYSNTKPHKKHILRILNTHSDFFDFGCRDCGIRFLVTRAVVRSTYFAAWEIQTQKYLLRQRKEA